MLTDRRTDRRTSPIYRPDLLKQSGQKCVMCSHHPQNNVSNWIISVSFQIKLCCNLLYVYRAALAKPPGSHIFFKSGQKCQFSKTITQQLIVLNYFEIGPMVDLLLIFKVFFNWLPWQQEFFMDYISFRSFEKMPQKEQSCEVWFQLAKRFRMRCCLKFYYMYTGENKPHPLAAMLFYESGQKCKFSKTITQNLFL